MFCLALNIQHTPCPPSIMFSILTALGEVLTTCSPYVLDLKAFLERQLDCLDAQQSLLLCKSLVIQGGGSPFCHFPHFSTDIFEMQPPHMQCFTAVSNYVTASVLSTHATACRQGRKQVICIQSKYFVITCCSS